MLIIHISFHQQTVENSVLLLKMYRRWIIDNCTFIYSLYFINFPTQGVRCPISLTTSISTTRCRRRKKYYAYQQSKFLSKIIRTCFSEKRRSHSRCCAKQSIDYMYANICFFSDAVIIFKLNTNVLNFKLQKHQINF